MTTEIVPDQKIRFYTTAYAGKDINDLKSMLDRLDAVLVDVRFSPTDEIMRWRQIYLKTLLRENYHHISQLGSRETREGRIQIQHLDLGIKILISFNSNAVLMCGCPDSKTCHRRNIAEELRRKGYEAEELEDWKAAEINQF